MKSNSRQDRNHRQGNIEKATCEREKIEHFLEILDFLRHKKRIQGKIENEKKSEECAFFLKLPLKIERTFWRFFQDFKQSKFQICRIVWNIF
jgi:hypothetical protein